MKVAQIIAAAVLLSSVVASSAHAQGWTFNPYGGVVPSPPAAQMQVPVVGPSVPTLPAVQPNPAAQGMQIMNPDAQRIITCLIGTNGNYFACGANEAFYEMAKCVNGVGVPGGCFAPKVEPAKLAKALKTRG